MPFVTQANELNARSATPNIKPLLATELPGINDNMESCLHRQTTHTHINMLSSDAPRGLEI